MKAGINAIFSAILLLVAVPTIQAMKPVERIINSTKKQLSSLANAVQRVITGETPTNVVITQLNTPPTNPLSDPNGSDFYNLPPHERQLIIFLLSQFGSSNNLSSIGQAIRGLAQVNTELNTLINDPEFYRNMSKGLVYRFGVSDEEVATALQTKEAKRVLEYQQYLRNLCSNKNKLNVIQTITAFRQLMKNNVDLNFTYKDRGFPLLIAIMDNPTLAFLILDAGVNVSQRNEYGNRALNAAKHRGDDELIRVIQEKLNQKK